MRRVPIPWFWLCALAGLTASLPAAPMLVTFGTYTQATSRGIYAAWFDPNTGSLSAPFLAAEALNPTFLAVSPDGRRLYSTGEFPSTPASTPTVGGVSAYAVDAASGRLELLNRQATGGGSTTHVAVDATGRMVAVANYNAAYVAALPIRADGSLGPRSAFIEHRGLAPHGPNPDRQKQAYAHSITFAPDNRFLYACDLGLDRIVRYAVDSSSAHLQLSDPPAFAAPPGAGPRHAKFSADGRFLYVANEMGGSICVYACEPASGSLALRQTISTLPESFDAGRVQNTVAEIRIHPNGRFVYVSNRGDDSIAVFARDSAEGTLRSVEIVPCGGRHPRNFALDPGGTWLLCANRDTDNIVVFKVDPATGRLTATGRQIAVSRPVCVLFVPVPE